MIEEFYYITCLGSYARGMFCPFNTFEEAREFLTNEEIKEREILFEGIDEYKDYTIKVKPQNFCFDKYSICQRKKDEILEESYME